MQFKNKKELKHYIEICSNSEINDLASDIEALKDAINLRFDIYRGEVAKALYEQFEDEKSGILAILEIASKALNYDKLDYLEIDYKIDDANSDMINSIYSEYLSALKRLNSYFTNLYSICDMFASNLYGIGNYPTVPGIITGAYNGRNGGYDRSEVQTKFMNSILRLNEIFDKETH